MPENNPSGSLKTMHQILGQAEHLSGWIARRDAEMKLTRHVQKQLPPLLAANTRVSGLKDEKLKLSVPTGASATVLKQHAPAIIAMLRESGYECKSISIHVQPLKTAKKPIKEPFSLPPPPRKRLLSLLETLPEGKLKSSVKSLLKVSV